MGILLLAIFTKDKFKEKNSLIFNMFYLNILIRIIMGSNSVIGRFNYYTGVYLALYIGELTCKLRIFRNRKIQNMSINVLYILLYLHYIMTVNNILPYKFNFEIFK